jgi:hypothetical protein
MKITKKQLQKMRRKADRNIALELGLKPLRHKIHRTSKKDVFDRTKNTIRQEEM